MELRTRQIGAFGKLSNAGDFVTMGAKSDAALRFQDYLFEAVEYAYEHEPTWRETATSDRAFAFLFRSSDTTPGQGLIAGVLRGSRDAAGRVFPFAVFAEIDIVSPGSYLHLLPLGLGSFLEQASLALDEAVETPGTRDPTMGVIGPSSLQIRPAFDDYSVWTTSRSVQDAWLTLFGRDRPDDLAHALSTLTEILVPLRGQEPPPTKLAVRLPLGAAGSGAVSFWWDTVRRLGHWQRNVPNLFWEGGVPEPQVAMHFGRISPRALAELWRPDAQSPQVSDLSVAPADRPEVQSDAAQTLQRWLETPGTTVSEFLSAL
jgi:type VI secretion system ImpM family protein